MIREKYKEIFVDLIYNDNMDIFNNNRICRNLFACMKQLIKSVHVFTRYMSIKWTKWAILNLSHICPMMKH
jgi:hypothetical protein